MSPASAQALQRQTALILLGAIAVCILLQAWLALVMEVNWDEFFYLSQIYAYRRGEWTNALQSLHVHLLGWLIAVPGDEIVQVIAGRLVMLACFVGTCGLIYWLSRAFLSQLAALVVVVLFASSGFSIVHGASFRTDPLAAFLMIGSLAVLARGPMTLLTLAAAALLAAVAGMVTIKVALYAPAFLGIACWRILAAADRRNAALWLAGLGFATAVSIVILFLFQLGPDSRTAGAGSTTGLNNAASTQFGGAWLPRAGEIIRFISFSPFQTFLLLTGFGLALAMLRDREKRPQAIALVGCGACLLWLLVYRNAFPYFFPFILAPVAVVGGLAIDRLTLLRKHALLLVAAMVCVAVLVTISFSARGQRTQRQVVSTVHALFPQPVPYIDRNSMIASFPKRGFFMSTWGLQGYNRTGRPVVAPLLERDVVPLVVVNGPALENAFGGLEGLPPHLALLPADKVTLQENYIAHWGPIYVAGKVIVGVPGGSAFNIAIPGTYTIERSAATIDGTDYRAGEVVTLARGPHRAEAASGSRVILRWGKNLPRPAHPFVGPIYSGF